MTKLLATTAESTEMLGIGRTKLFGLLRGGELQAVRLGRKTLIAVSELERFASTLPARDSGQRFETAPGGEPL